MTLNDDQKIVVLDSLEFMLAHMTDGGTLEEFKSLGYIVESELIESLLEVFEKLHSTNPRLQKLIDIRL